MSITYLDEIPDVKTYHELRTAVEWCVFCKEQSEKALKNSCFCVVAKDGDQTVAMGRAVGDGMYYTIVDVMVKPQYQGQKIGSTIINRLVELINGEIPEGGRTSIQLIAALGKEALYEAWLKTSTGILLLAGSCRRDGKTVLSAGNTFCGGI